MHTITISIKEAQKISQFVAKMISVSREQFLNQRDTESYKAAKELLAMADGWFTNHAETNEKAPVKQTNSNGNGKAAIKADGTPKKKPGRKPKVLDKDTQEDTLNV